MSLYKFMLGAAATSILLVFSAIAPALAAESYDNCTGYIDTVPATITTQGTWCLRKDISTSLSSGAAITIATNNVTIDCNDFKVGGLAAGSSTQAVGMLAENRLNVTVRNCNVRGFFAGVSFFGSGGGGHLVQNNRFNANTRHGVRIDGDGSTIRGNLINDTGGATGSPYSGIAEGIFSNGDVDIIDNTISGVLPAEDDFGGSFALGIEYDGSASGTISGNRIRGLLPAAGATPSVIGIHAYANGRVAILDNHIVGTGLSNVGVECSSSQGQVKNNLILGFIEGMQVCNDAGGNTLQP